MSWRSALRLSVWLLAAGVATNQGSPSAAADAPASAALSELDVADHKNDHAGLLDRIKTARAALKENGIEISATYIGEVFSNPKGGLRRGTAYEGRLDIQFDADLAVIAGWEGLTLHSNVYQFHGTGPTRYFVGSLASVSGIEALPSTRLHELWFEQALFDKAFTVRAGKLAADAEFLVSPSATLFINASLGWPVDTSANLPSGGPAAPFAVPAIRAKWMPSEKTSVMVGVFNGDPASARSGLRDVDPQRRNSDGLDFSIDDAPFLIAEAAHQYTAGGPGPERTGTVKVGYFHHFGRFDHPRTDALGLPLASPLSIGTPLRRAGQDGFYAVLDQTIYREDADSDRGAAAFVRVIGSPNATSLVSGYVDAGVVYKGLIPGRPSDVAGLSIGYSRIADGLRGYDRDLQAFAGITVPIRRAETFVEATYQAVIAPGFTIQPDIQYIVAPGGNTWNTSKAGHFRVNNCLIFGARATIQY